ncbi:MAG TPA: hypothetical protein P5230_02490 [Candidatus Magasanikbacteria bacterium]|nr:hypothetical protein [Candidatus Magasanikbacteria bacterium]
MSFVFSIPLYAFLFAFFGFLVIFVIFFFIDLYHIFETSSLTMTSLAITVLITTVSALTIFFLWYLLQDVDWKTAITVFDSAWITDIFNLK